MTIADIAHGEVDTADIMFLLAVIASVIALIAHAARVALSGLVAGVALSFAIGAIAMGLLVL